MNLSEFSKKCLRHPLVACSVLGIMVAIVFAALYISGILQGLELKAFDQQLLNRPMTTIDKRIVVIGETEADVRRLGHPLSDQVLSDALLALEKAGARVIGVDKYRDIPVAPGTDQLKNTLQKYDNIVWIFFAGNSPQEFISAPAAISKDPERMGFNDVVDDPDGVTRRGLLFMDVDSNTYYAFPLLLALHYLKVENIGAQSDTQGSLSLNGISLPAIDQHFGAYNAIDSAGYQIILDYPGLPQSFSFYTLADLLDGKISGEAIHDKIVLLGGTAPSLNDYRLLPNQIRQYGVHYHAYLTSQLLNTALYKNPPLSSWSDNNEFLWLIAWCLVGSLSALFRGGLSRLVLLITGEALLLIISNIVLLRYGWWVPLITPLMALGGSFSLSVLYFSAQEHIERRQLMQLFACHVSPQVAATLWEAREQFFSEGGVRPDTLTATVLFTDLSNFTTVAESMEPLVLMSWLNQYMEEMSRIVIDHGGVINKYIGDAIMAIFGVPVKRETESDIAYDAKQAVLCALDFNRRLRELNQQWQEQGLPTITMRTGIHTGSLVAGSFGGSLRMEYTVIGDTVNTASRLESFDKTIAPPSIEHPCRILIGETTQNYVQHLCETQIVGECQLKGKNKLLKIYQVIKSLST